MKRRITELDIRCAAARREFLAITDSDIQSAYGKTTPRQNLSGTAQAVYDEVVRQEEAQAGCEAERFGEEHE